MQRLKELDTPTSPIEADAVALLRSAAGYEPPQGQKQRVRARLLQKRVTRHAVVFRPAVATGVILFTAVASAAVGRRWIAETIQVFVHAPAAEKLAVAPESVPPPRRRAKKMGSISTVSAPSTGSTEVTGANKPELDSTIAASPVGLGVGRAGTNRVVPARSPGIRHTLAAAKSPDGRETERTASRDGFVDGSLDNALAMSSHSAEDTSLVFDAMRALRQEDRPQLAAKLLDEYLRRYPEGSLAEEALALSIEAAAARGDARAHKLVGQYLSRYPIGHFRAAVENASARLAQ